MHLGVPIGSALKSRRKAASKDQFVEVVQSLEKYLGNPLSRFILNVYTKQREGSSTPLIESLKWYCGETDNRSILSLARALPVHGLLELGRASFGLTRGEIVEAISDDVKRRVLSNVFRSIAHYGITKPQNLSAPFLVVWNLTNACNLRCLHCYQNAGRPLPDELTLEEKLDVVDQLSSMDVAMLAFSGGEPTMARDFLPVAKYAADSGMYVSVATNGTLLTDRRVRDMVEAGVKYVDISVDGVNPETHDNFRGVRGAWNRTIQGIRRCLDAGLTTCMATTLTRYNFDEFDGIVDFAKRLGVHRLIFFNFIPTGRGREIVEADLTPAMREQLMHKEYEELDKGFTVVTTAPQFARVCLTTGEEGPLGLAHFGDARIRGKARAISEFVGGCGCGRLYCALQPNGVVTPCVFLPLRVGSLRETSFKEIWDHSPALVSLRTREDLGGYCGPCQFRDVCGGCRARSYGYFGTLKGPDIGCVYNNRLWKEFVRSQEKASAAEKIAA
ncbi:MAG: radical SAM protein [Candidatus Geothermarchaeales archaeon]